MLPVVCGKQAEEVKHSDGNAVPWLPLPGATLSVTVGKPCRQGRQDGMLLRQWDVCDLQTGSLTRGAGHVCMCPLVIVHTRVKAL